jgi:hypothetical protein
MGSVLEQAGEAGRIEELRVLYAVARKCDLEKYGASFNLPLHRLLATLLQV